jgi:hypothetical protein
MPKTKSAAHVEVADAAAALHNMENFTRKILAVPKKQIDAKLAKEKHKRKK